MAVVEVAHDRAEGRLSELMGVINSATAELVEVLGDVIDRDVWAVGGVRSPEQWVAWQCGVSPRRSRDLVCLARRRAELPAMTKLFDAGLVSEDAAAAVARRAPADRDGEVAELAPVLLHTQLTRWLSAVPRPAEPDVDPDVEAARRVVVFGAAGDRWRCRMDLPVDDGLVVEKALVSCRSQVFHEHHPDAPDAAEWRSGVTWADGAARMAELALTGLDLPSHRRPSDRYQILFHIDAATGSARWHQGDLVPDSVRRYLTCDADLRAVLETDGTFVALSSRLRTVDDRLRALIEHRDRGCVVPGCTQHGWLHIHHIRHWHDGGHTEPSNLCALCPTHHRLHHAGLLSIEGNPDTPLGLIIRDARGQQLKPPPPTPPDHPPQPPPHPYQHPDGGHVDWRYLGWNDLN